MQDRFEKLNLSCDFYLGVDLNDNRIFPYKDLVYVKSWSCMLGHLDMIEKFYKSDKDYAFFCEDDILLHKNFQNLIPILISDFIEMKLDVLLIGYLLNFKAKNSWLEKINCSNNILDYYKFPNDVWGTQMYLLSKSYAKFIIDNYSIEYATKTISQPELTPFSADWIITKNGNRALVAPILAIEDNSTFYDSQDQNIFHKSCYDVNYISNIYI